MEQSKSAPAAGDLIWWRNSGETHTTVTLWGGTERLSLFGPEPPEAVTLECRVHDAAGRERKRWQREMRPGAPVIIDSREHGDAPEEGVLTIEPLGVDTGYFQRFFSMVDWWSEGGEIVCLHSDHSLSKEGKGLEFTEIVVRETAERRHTLVFLNGAHGQPGARIRLRARNGAGETIEGEYEADLAPFSLHKVALGAVLPDLCGFCGDGYVTVEGYYPARDSYHRPYVVIEGDRPGGYHGGDRYRWNALPALLYRAFGGGEMNPMFAVENETISTTVNILHSHGDLEEDYWVDADLYDSSGRLAVSRRRWLAARRNGVSRGRIRELLGEGSGPFTGYVALRFHDEGRAAYPRRLQALLEYGTAVSTAGVMAWSDIWNARDIAAGLRENLAGFFPVERFYREAPAPAGEPFLCHYRVWASEELESVVTISNCGLTPEYGGTAEATIRLFNAAGEVREVERRIGPQATLVAEVRELFPEAEEFLAPGGIGLLSVVSHADLAMIQLTRHKRSGACGAEHFMAENRYVDGVNVICCGS